MEGRQLNSERFIVFQDVILQRKTEVRQVRDIRQRAERQIVDWHAIRCLMLIEDTTRTSRAMMLKVARGVLEEAISKTFTSLFLKGKIRAVVRFVTLRGVGGVLLPNDIDAKSGRPVVDVLRGNHLAPIVPDIEVLEYYDVVSEFVMLDIMEDTVEKISGRLTVTASPGGIDAAGL